MRKNVHIGIALAILFILATITSAQNKTSPAPIPTKVKEPPKWFNFTENKGQWDPHVLFKCIGHNGMTWFLEREGITMVTMTRDTTKPPIEDPMARGGMAGRFPPRYPMKGHVLKFKFVKSAQQLAAEKSTSKILMESDKSVRPPNLNDTSNSAITFSIDSDLQFVEPDSFKDMSPAQIERQQLVDWYRKHLAQDPYDTVVDRSKYTTPEAVVTSGKLSWKNNYFIGKDSTKWAPHCRNYTGLTYRNVWPGIDVEWHEQNGSLKFDFVVQPGADPKQILINVDGLEGAMEATKPDQEISPQSISTGKELSLPTSLGDLRTALPGAYQISDNGVKTEVEARFELKNAKQFGIALPHGYNPKELLRIDPIVYSTCNP